MDTDTIVRFGLILLILIAVVIALLSRRGSRNRRYNRAGARWRPSERRDSTNHDAITNAGFWAWNDTGGGGDSGGGGGGGGGVC
jgi:hypothetical protein